MCNVGVHKVLHKDLYFDDIVYMYLFLLSQGRLGGAPPKDELSASIQNRYALISTHSGSFVIVLFNSDPFVIVLMQCNAVHCSFCFSVFRIEIC